MLGWYGHAWGPWIGILWFAVWALVVFGVVFALRRGRSRWHPDPAESALGERYARGEIGEEEYRQRRAVLRERGR